MRMWVPTRRTCGEGRCCWEKRRPVGIGRAKSDLPNGPTGVMAMACLHTENQRNTGDPTRRVAWTQPDARERQAGSDGESEGSILPLTPGNAG